MFSRSSRLVEHDPESNAVAPTDRVRLVARHPSTVVGSLLTLTFFDSGPPRPWPKHTSLGPSLAVVELRRFHPPAEPPERRKLTGRVDEPDLPVPLRPPGSNPLARGLHKCKYHRAGRSVPVDSFPLRRMGDP